MIWKQKFLLTEHKKLVLRMVETEIWNDPILTSINFNFTVKRYFIFFNAENLFVVSQCFKENQQSSSFETHFLLWLWWWCKHFQLDYTLSSKLPLCLKFNFIDNISVLCLLSRIDCENDGEHGAAKKYFLKWPLLWYCISMTMLSSFKHYPSHLVTWDDVIKHD